MQRSNTPSPPSSNINKKEDDVALHEILPTTGRVYCALSNLVEVLAKPKILPLKSRNLLKMEALERKLKIEQS